MITGRGGFCPNCFSEILFPAKDTGFPLIEFLYRVPVVTYSCPLPTYWGNICDSMSECPPAHAVRSRGCIIYPGKQSPAQADMRKPPMRHQGSYKRLKRISVMLWFFQSCFPQLLRFCTGISEPTAGTKKRV